MYSLDVRRGDGGVSGSRVEGPLLSHASLDLVFHGRGIIVLCIPKKQDEIWLCNTNESAKGPKLRP